VRVYGRDDRDGALNSAITASRNARRGELRLAELDHYDDVGVDIVCASKIGLRPSSCPTRARPTSNSRGDSGGPVTLRVRSDP
jgi:hypothetical protein